MCSVPCVSDQARQAFSREFDVSGSASMNALWSGHKFACSPSGRQQGLGGGRCVRYEILLFTRSPSPLSEQYYSDCCYSYSLLEQTNNTHLLGTRSAQSAFSPQRPLVGFPAPWCGLYQPFLTHPSKRKPENTTLTHWAPPGWVFEHEERTKIRAGLSRQTKDLHLLGAEASPPRRLRHDYHLHRTRRCAGCSPCYRTRALGRRILQGAAMRPVWQRFGHNEHRECHLWFTMPVRASRSCAPPHEFTLSVLYISVPAGNQTLTPHVPISHHCPTRPFRHETGLSSSSCTESPSGFRPTLSCRVRVD